MARNLAKWLIGDGPDRSCCECLLRARAHVISLCPFVLSRSFFLYIYSCFLFFLFSNSFYYYFCLRACQRPQQQQQQIHTHAGPSSCKFGVNCAQFASQSGHRHEKKREIIARYAYRPASDNILAPALLAAAGCALKHTGIL